MKKQIIVAFVIICLLTAANAQGMQYIPRLGTFVKGSSRIFPIGWYLSNKNGNVSIPGINNEDPFGKYYNTHIVYTEYNKMRILLKKNLIKIHSYLDTPLNFIVDLPRYSSEYRILFSYNAYDPASAYLSSHFKVYDADDNLNQSKKNPDFKKADGFETGMQAGAESFTVIEPVNSSIINPANAIIYAYPDIVSIKFKPYSGNYAMAVIISYEDDSRIIICGGNAYEIFKGNRNTVIISNLTDVMYGSKISRHTAKELFDIGIITVLDDNVEDDVWKTYSVNLNRLSEYNGIKRTNKRVSSVKIAIKNLMLGNVVFMNKKEKTLERCEAVIDGLAGKKNILGFYVCDEFEWKELLHNDRYNTLSEHLPFKNYLTGSQNGNSLLEITEDICGLIEKRGQTPFVLSTGSSGQGYRDMLDDETASLRRNFLMFDYYGYNDKYAELMIKAKQYALKNRIGLIYVGDAYSDRQKKPLGFILNKYRFFSPLAAGADGMFFYSYFSPPPEGKILLEDPDKMNLGYFTKMFSQYGIIDAFTNHKETVLAEMIMTVAKNKQGNVFIARSGANGLNNYYGLNYDKPLIKEFSNEELQCIERVAGKGEFTLIDITHYIPADDSIINDENAFVPDYHQEGANRNTLSIYAGCDTYSLLMNSHDVKMIMLVGEKHNLSILDECRRDCNGNLIIVFNYPQLVSKESLMFVECESTKSNLCLIEMKETKTAGLKFVGKRTQYYTDYKGKCMVVFRDIWGMIHSMDVY